MATDGGDSTTQRLPKRTRKKLVITLDEDSLKLPKLPPELILEILLRLPVKSLLQFKSVCKSWRAMISEPQFVKKHLSVVTKDDTINPWRILIQYPSRNLKSCSLHSIFHEPYGFGVDLEFPLKILGLDVGIVGSCDGLVCIYYLKDHIDMIVIWNPSTRKFRIVQSFGKGLNIGISYGFGYDSSNDDYKVVRIGYTNGPHEVMIFSLRTNSWRKLQDFPTNIVGFYSMDSGKLVNGSLNWVATNPSDHSWVITTLDLAEEIYREIPLPNFGKEFSRLSVWALRGNLCVVCEDAFTFVDVWVMNEYGKKESWIKLVSMPYLPEQSPIYCSEPLWYLKDGGILMNFNGTFGLYDLKEHTFKLPFIYGVPDFHEADIYLESLVSPDAFM